MGVFRAHHVDLGPVLVVLGWQAESLERFAFAVESRDGALAHHAEPEIAFLIGPYRERFRRITFLEFRQRVFGHFAGARIEHSERRFAEIGKPDQAIAGDDHVMGLHSGTRKVIFRDDRPRVATGRARESFQLIVPVSGFAQIGSGHEFSKALQRLRNAVGRIGRANAYRRRNCGLSGVDWLE